VVVVADGNELAQVRTWADLDRSACGERAVVSHERAWSERDTAVTVYGDSRRVIDFAACAELEPCVGVEEKSTAATDTNRRPYIETRMEKPPVAGPEHGPVATRTPLDSVQTHLLGLPTVVSVRRRRPAVSQAERVHLGCVTIDAL
jgi:hypothetical protein